MLIFSIYFVFTDSVTNAWREPRCVYNEHFPPMRKSKFDKIETSNLCVGKVKVLKYLKNLELLLGKLNLNTIFKINKLDYDEHSV